MHGARLTPISARGADNKQLQRHKEDIAAAFCKQLKLIDVLKRQKLHLESARALTHSEQQFSRILSAGVAAG